MALRSSYRTLPQPLPVPPLQLQTLAFPQPAVACCRWPVGSQAWLRTKLLRQKAAGQVCCRAGPPGFLAAFSRPATPELWTHFHSLSSWCSPAACAAQVSTSAPCIEMALRQSPLEQVLLQAPQRRGRSRGRLASPAPIAAGLFGSRQPLPLVMLRGRKKNLMPSLFLYHHIFSLSW